jgi:hypothetical protein
MRYPNPWTPRKAAFAWRRPLFPPTTSGRPASIRRVLPGRVSILRGPLRRRAILDPLAPPAPRSSRRIRAERRPRPRRRRPASRLMLSRRRRRFHRVRRPMARHPLPRRHRPANLLTCRRRLHRFRRVRHPMARRPPLRRHRPASLLMRCRRPHRFHLVRHPTARRPQPRRRRPVSPICSRRLHRMRLRRCILECRPNRASPRRRQVSRDGPGRRQSPTRRSIPRQCRSGSIR